MKKLLVFLLLCTTGLWAQITMPTVAELDFPSGQNLTMAYVPNGYYAYKSTTPSMAVHKMIQADSLPSQRWKMTVGKRLNATTWELQVDGSLIASPNVRIAYKDTVNLTTVSTGIAIPDRVVQLENNGGEMTQIVPYQTTWRVPFKSTGITSGDVIEWIFTRSVPVQADSTGVMFFRPKFTSSDSLNTY